MTGKFLYKFLMKHAASRTMLGRYRDPDQPELGRFGPQDISITVNRTFELAAEMIPEANLSQYRTKGNRFNVALGVFSRAAYRALRELGLNKDWAIEIFADMGWSMYVLGVKIPLFFIRPFTRNPQTRLNFVLRMFLFFPFSEDPVGYKRTYGKETDHYRTDWHRCAVYDYFRSHATEDELDMFRRSWCLYDFALPGLIHPEGHYERPHTLSAGDEVCDMRWYGRKPGNK